MVHEHPHTNDRKGLVLLALAVSAQIICLLQFKVIIGAVVVEDILPAFKDLLAVLIQLCLDEIILLREHREGPVDIMQLERRLFEERA